MNRLVTYLIWIALFVAGLIGITLSVPLQAPAVILLGIAAVLAAIQVMKCGSPSFAEATVGRPEVLESKVKSQKVEDRTSKSSTRLLWFVVIAIGYFVGRACSSPVWDLGVEDLMLILSAGSLYLVAGYGVKGQSGALLRQSLAWVVVILLLLHLGSCLLQLDGGDGFSLTHYFEGSTRASADRITGMYGYYGSFANFAVISGLLCLSLGVWGRMRYLYRAILFLFGIGALGLAIGSQSRSAAMSLVVGLCVYGLLIFVSLAQQRNDVRKRVGSLLIVLSVSGVLLGGVGGYMVFKNRSDNTTGMEMVFDAGVRLPFWSMAVEQWADYPVVGAGSRSYSYECFRYWNPNLGTESGNPEFVHNEYLQLLADYGLVGLLLILLLIVWHLFIATKRIRYLSLKLGEDGLKRGSNAMALSIAGVSGMVAMAVHITFDFRTHLLANLLLLVCCAVWILPVAKSTVWKSGSQEVRKSRMGSWVLGIVMMVLGLGAVGLGGQQLWAGLPLIKHKMAKEDGAWVPQTVDRGVWIPALEESLARTPQWRRYQRLGTLYRIEADALLDTNKTEYRSKAENAYLASIERHPYNPIPYINLAAIYTKEGQYEKADQVYAKTADLAKAREHWFRMHQHWGGMHCRWAFQLRTQKEYLKAETHYQRSQELYWQSKKIAIPHNKDWRKAYLEVSYEYIYFLLEQKQFDEATVLVEKCEKEAGRSTVLRVHADSLLAYGEFLWFSRKPEQAMQYMYAARNKYMACKRWNPSAVDARWQTNLKKVEEVIKFLKLAGVKPSES